jgi:hypothetical protein
MGIIFLQEGYDPFPNANSICVKGLVDEYAKNNDDYLVVCDGYIGEETNFSKNEHIVHIRVKREKSISKKTTIQKVITLMKRVSLILIWPIRFPVKTIKYIVRIRKELKKNDEVIIVSVYKPAEMIEIGYWLKIIHKNIIWVIYSLDGIGDNLMAFNSKIIRNKEKRWMASRFKKADKIIQMKCHEESYKNSEYKKFLSKTVFTDFPLIIPNEYCNDDNNTNEKKEIVNILYAGAFYKKLREPFELIQWFEKYSEKVKAHLDIYSMNDFVDYLDDISQKSNGKIERRDYVRPEVMEKIIAESDILLSVGNSNSPMVPSKIFNYISSGKIIVHFTDSYNDSCLPYLQKYKRAIIIGPEERRVNITMDNKKIAFNEIAALYAENLPITTVKELIEQGE